MDIIRAWTDEDYRMSLTDEQRALLPAHPAGPLELTDEHLKSIVGGNLPATEWGPQPTWGCCTADRLCHQQTWKPACPRSGDA